jgi:hypothetical protein
MVDLKILESRGVTQANLRQKLAIDPLNVPTGPDDSDQAKVGRLIHRIRSRIQEGMTRNLADYKIWYALDQAWETPFRQVTPTLVQQFMDRDPQQEDVYRAFQDWGLTHLIDERADPKGGKPIRKLNLPTFFNVVVPLVRSYVTIRWAKIMNDRRLTPFYKYEPVDQTTVLNTLCKALTDRVQVMSTQYGYFDVTKQAVLKMLHYSYCLLFPKEEWHKEDTLKYADDVDVLLEHKKEDGTPASNGDVIRVTEREGIRYHIPHPSRTFYDLAHGPYTLNYDYGCEYAGYWRIARYREISGMAGIWNADRIPLGTVDMISGNRLFFTTVYSSCTLTIPIATPPKKTPDGPVLPAELGIGSGTMDREREIATLYYGTEHGDQGVLVTEYWERLIPKDNGLGDYDCPVWFRFLVAGDGCTILYAAPVPYSPVIYYGYDADESRTKNSSLSLEILPFQDHFSNMLTQIILTCKQNLANLTFIDEDQLLTGDANQRMGAKDTIDQIRNLGENYYRFLNIFGYSSKKAMRLQVGSSRGVPDVVQSWNFPRGNVAEMSNVLRTILEILERVLVMSSQEIAQAASHELRVDEVRNIAQSTSSRLQFTATPVDIGRDAHKRQLYIGLMQYGDEDFWVHLPSDTPLTQDQLAQFGFTVHKKEDLVAKDQFRRYNAKKKHLSAIPLWSLASTRDGEDRIDNTRTAQAMGMLLQQMMANPIIAPAIGADQAIEWCNRIARLAGIEKDFKLRNVAPQADAAAQQQAEAQRQQEAQQQLQQVIQMVLKETAGEIEKEMTPVIDIVQKVKDRVDFNTQEIALLFKAANLPFIDPAKDDYSTPTGNGARAAAPAT